MDSNQFDLLGSQPEWSEDDKVHFERLDYLYHRVFAETEEGRELLETWLESLQMTPNDIEGSDLYSLGKQEGIKTFIRNIILTVRKVEDE